MVWFKVDDTLPTHHRVIQAGNAAMGLWVRCGAWSMGQLTDGHIPTAVARMFGTPEEAQALVDCGLWEDATNGYQFHRWAEDASGAPRQPTKADIDAKRKIDRERKQQQAANARAAIERRRSAQTPDGVASDSIRNPDGTPLESTDLSVNPDPTRPDPTYLPTSDEVGKARKRTPRQRGTRIPDQFMLTTEMLTWAHTNTPGLNINRSTEKFVNYWRAKTGRDATKLDWTATWRNWILTDHERQPAQRNQQRPTKDDRAAATIRLGAEVQAAFEAQTDSENYLDLKGLPA